MVITYGFCAFWMTYIRTNLILELLTDKCNNNSNEVDDMILANLTKELQEASNQKMEQYNYNGDIGIFSVE